MEKINEYSSAKLILGVASVAIGFPAFAFALFSWLQSAQSLLGFLMVHLSIRKLRRHLVGSSLAREGLIARKSRSALSFKQTKLTD